MTKRPAIEANQELSNPATQAGIEKGLVDELAKGNRCAARALVALDGQQYLTLLIEAEIAYQNALCLVKQAGTVPGYIAQSLQQLGTFLERNDSLQGGN
jgi:hypothetical protein